MKKLVLGLLVLLLALPLLAQENPLEMTREQYEEESGKVVFESILKDADFYPFIEGRTIPCWGQWVLKFENGAVIRIPVEQLIRHQAREIFWIGKKYQVITSESKTRYEVRLLGEKVEKGT